MSQHSGAPRKGYSQAAKTAVQQTAARVREMHGAIAGQTFGVLKKVPVISTPARLIERAHDGISALVYQAIQHSAAASASAAGLYEQQRLQQRPEKPQSRLASALQGALNGVFGDHLQSDNNRLAIDMILRLHGRSLLADAASLREAFPGAGGRVCLFLHGLCCDEHCWQPDPKRAEQIDLVSHLEQALGCHALYLRYNSGLPITENGRQLAQLLQQLVENWPEPDLELVIIGHSMGGLVARSAIEQAAAAGLGWPFATHMLVSIGTPYDGSPVERVGEAITRALGASDLTAPLGRLAASRSQGIQDLRQGPGPAREVPGHGHIAYRFIASSLAEDVTHPLASVFGDGLVPLASASGHALDGDVQVAQLGGLGHMGLLTDARVLALLLAWLDESGWHRVAADEGR